jgi:precorrin-6Y C5,15-methyltransferase (decarboxylating)
MLYIIGLGIEGISSLSQRALKIIENSSLLVGGKRHLNSFPDFKGKKSIITSNLDGIAGIIKDHLSSVTPDPQIVVLATGDPNFFGIADFLTKRFHKDEIEVIPNVTTMQEAFARIKESWNNARFLSVHGRDRDIGDVVNEISKYEKIGIFTDNKNTPQKVVKALLDAGIKDYKAYVCENLGTEKEAVTGGTLQQISKKRFSPLNVLVLIRDEGTRKHHLGIPDSGFSHPRGMITKEEVRVISLSKLRLGEGSILWDIGAGCGSLSIEAAHIARDGRVFAIEKKKSRIVHIKKNKKRFASANLEIIHKDAINGLDNLPDPDAIFIGGGGEYITRILEICSERIRRGGRIVINAVTLETLARVTEFFKKSGWAMETISVNIAKTKGISAKNLRSSTLNIFNAHNPVFIIVGERP